MKTDLLTILQKLYDSEINLAIAWCWDWGLSYTLEPEFYLEKVNFWPSTDERDLKIWFEMLIKEVIEKYPNSTFTEWYNSI